MLNVKKTMMKPGTRIRRVAFSTGVLLCLLLQAGISRAQTDEDAIMMSKNNFCVGGTFTYSSWKNYWEGTFKRDNLNLGTVSTKMYGLMGNYGITSKLNIMVS